MTSRNNSAPGLAGLGPTPLSDFTFQTGPFAGMTFTQVQQSVKQQLADFREGAGFEEDKGTSTGTGAGVLGAAVGIPAAIKYGPDAIGSLLGGAGAEAAGAGATTATTGAAPTVLGQAMPSAAIGPSPAPLGIGGGAGGGGASGGASAASPGMLGGLTVPLAGAGVAAYYGPSAIEHGGNILQGEAGADSAVKGALMTNPVTAWTVPLMDAFGVDIKSGKHADQHLRDAWRGSLEDQGLTTDYQLKLPGGTFDMGSESLRGLNGGPVLEGLTPDNRSYNVDLNRKGVDQQIGAIQPLAQALIGSGNQKAFNDLTGTLTNAALSGGDAMANIRSIYDQAGGRNAVYGSVLGDQSLDQGTRNAYLAAIDRVYGVANPNG